jgi:Kdo2-lipid IVA lauroyltransferase/acyltransferase
MIAYFFVKVFAFFLQFLPFKAIYWLSDAFTWLMYHLVRYRKAVIMQNLRNAFPDKTSLEIKHITKETYRNLCDIILESLKGMSLSESQFRAHYRFLNVDIFEEYAQKEIIVLAGHLNNWEWGVISLPLALHHHQAVGIYKPIKNIYIEKYISKKRERFGMELVAMKKTREALLAKRVKPAIFFFISDQTPSNLKNVVWLQFLNQDTACFLGADAIARAHGHPVFSITPHRIRRGYYEVTFSPVCIDTAQAKEGEIITTFLQKLEAHIVPQPQNWLWSHKRWKHQRG